MGPSGLENHIFVIDVKMKKIKDPRKIFWLTILRAYIMLTNADFW